MVRLTHRRGVRSTGGARRIPIYVDANAVSPATVHAIAARLGADHVVDGAIIGPPAWESGHTVLWLSGAAAADVAELFAGSPFAARVLGTELGTASALKACFALQSKALPAIWLELAAAARGYGVEDALRGELDRHGVDFGAKLAGAARGAEKAWRWAGEMDEAADAVAAVDLPDGFSRAAAELYRRLTDGRLTPWSGGYQARFDAPMRSGSATRTEIGPVGPSGPTPARSRAPSRRRPPHRPRARPRPPRRRCGRRCGRDWGRRYGRCGGCPRCTPCGTPWSRGCGSSPAWRCATAPSRARRRSHPNVSGTPVRGA